MKNNVLKEKYIFCGGNIRMEQKDSHNNRRNFEKYFSFHWL